MTTSKIQLRQTFQAIRGRFSAAYRREAAMAAAEIFSSLPAFKASQHIGCYLPFNHEFDSQPMIERIWQAKKTCYLPVLLADKSLAFVCYQNGEALHHNRYGILEPVNISRQLAASELDIVIMPLIAFDDQGHRLGTGGGYYDRTFAFLPLSKTHKPLCLGLAYAAQQAEQLPADAWDIALNSVITEKGLIFCRHSVIGLP